MTATNAPPPMMPLVELLTVWRPGSHDAPWDWADERRALAADPAMPELRASIAAEGIRQPVLLGNDGRIWDGHHRICVALELGLDRIPIELAEPTPAPPPAPGGRQDHRPAPGLATAARALVDAWKAWNPPAPVPGNLCVALGHLAQAVAGRPANRLEATVRHLRAALDVAAAHVHPGPDGADDEIREDLIRGWLSDGGDDAASWAAECTQLALRLIVTQRAARRLLVALSEALPAGPGPSSDIRDHFADDRATLDALISAPTSFSRPLSAGLAAEAHIAEQVIDRFVPTSHHAAALAFAAELGAR